MNELILLHIASIALLILLALTVGLCGWQLERIKDIRGVCRRYVATLQSQHDRASADGDVKESTVIMREIVAVSFLVDTINKI